MHTGIVAREPELNFLDSCLHRVGRSQSIGLLVSGQPGVGKTALVEEFYHRAISRDFLACRCFLGDFGCGAARCFRREPVGTVPAQYVAVSRALPAISRTD